MATGKVTIGSLAKLEGWLWDTQCVGFGARRQKDGVFYYLRYRHNGSQIMKSIGRHGSPWTPDTARDRARELLGTVAGGTDPFAQSLAGEAFGAETLRYLDRKRASLKSGSFSEVTRYLRQYSAPLVNSPEVRRYEQFKSQWKKFSDAECIAFVRENLADVKYLVGEVEKSNGQNPMS